MNFFLTVTDNITSTNIDLFCLITLYILSFMPGVQRTYHTNYEIMQVA
jgi:hypothetical protein